jgi:hypothetical protein
VNGEAGAITSSGEYRDIVREIFDVVGRSIGEFNITVNGEGEPSPAVESFETSFGKSFDVVGRSTGHSVDYRLDVAYDDYPYETS